LKISQSVLAEGLELSRSNIAAYEIGNAEPNLTKLVKLAIFFKVSINDLITIDLSQTKINIRIAEHQNVSILNNTNFQKFETETIEVKNAISGLKQFFKFRTKNYSNISPEIKLAISDFENILSVSEHLVNVNEVMIESLKNVS
jgi:transcriptional regulator with XRE-family HTH domain